MELFFHNRDQNVDGNGDPHLRFDGVLAGPIERFDSKMLLDPLEEQFDLPSGLVELANGQRRQRQVVGQ